MSSITRRRQLRIDDERQILSPEGLSEGLHIGAINVHEVPSSGCRVFSTVLALTGFLEPDDGQSRIDSARSMWERNHVQGFVPIWRGFVEWCDRDGVMMRVTGGLEEPWRLTDLVNVDPCDLPEVVDPVHLYSTYQRLGLRAIGPMQELRMLDVSTDTGAEGRWHETAVLDLS